MRVAQLIENDEWQSKPPLPDDDPKSIKVAHRKTVSLTDQLNIIYHFFEKHRDEGDLQIVHNLATVFPSDIAGMDVLPRSPALGRVYLNPTIDPKLRARIIHLIAKYERIHKLHSAANDEHNRLYQLRDKKKQDKRELNKLKREHTRDLERAKQWERK